MRHHSLAMMAAVMAGTTGYATGIPEPYYPQHKPKEHDSERLAKALAKRERRAAKRIQSMRTTDDQHLATSRLGANQH